ncbi:MAG: pitrilysin family protein [Candidatus Solibacter sp.]
MKKAITVLLWVAVAYGQNAPTIPGLGTKNGGAPAKAKRGGAAPAAPVAGAAGRGAGAAPAAPAAGGAGRGAAAPGAPAAGRGATTAPMLGMTSATDLKYAPLRPLQEPASTTFTLPNGLKVFLLEDHDLPVVGGGALVKAGTLLDPPQRIGLAQLTGIALRTGGSNVKTPEQIDILMDDNAANVECNVTESTTSVTFSSLKENSAMTMQLFKELLVQPGFRQEKLEAAKTQLRFGISRRNDVARNVTRREFAALVYGKDNAFGWQPEYGTLDHIQRADVRAFHQRYFIPANTTLGIWGDFDTAEMKTRLEQVFGDWKAQPALVVDFGKVKNVPAPGVSLVERKDTQPTAFTIGQLGGVRSDKDFAALEVMGGVLQRHIAERLLRSNVTTEVSVVWGAGFLQPSLFEINGSSRPPATTGTVRVILEEIERMRTTEASDDDCRLARELLINTIIFNHDTRAKLFSRQMLLDYYGYPKDFLSQHQKALQAVGKADVLRVAKQYLNAANLTTVVMGNPTLFTESLDKLGTVTKIDISIPEAKPEVVETSEASLAQGKQILAQAQAAVGGADKLAAVQDSTTLAEYQIDPSVANIGGSKIGQTDRWVKATNFRQDSTLPSGRVSAYTDGKVGWIATPQGWGALAGAQRSQVYGDLFRVYFRLMLSDRIEGRTVNAIEDNTVQITDTTGLVSTVEFDPQTHLPKRVAYDTQQAGGAPIYSEDVYEDFRPVGGLLLPFKITINQGGRRFADTVVKEYKLNTGINPVEMGRRPQ